MIVSAIPAKRPVTTAWHRVDIQQPTEYPASGFLHKRLGLYVISAVEVAEREIGPEYHLSISKLGSGSHQPRRCSAAEAQIVLKQFGLEGAIEDNHSSLIRNFWMPVNESLIGHECDCKDDEAVIREGDFEWRPLTQENADRARAIGSEGRRKP